jgi:hypothetical protein
MENIEEPNGWRWLFNNDCYWLVVQLLHVVERLHLADLDETVSRRNVESTFSKFGKLSDVWVASYRHTLALLSLKMVMMLLMLLNL